MPYIGRSICRDSEWYDDCECRDSDLFKKLEAVGI